MSGLRQQIRAHYDAKEIPAEKAERILARGRAAAAGEETADVTKVIRFPASRARAWRKGLSLAAALLVFAGLAGWWAHREPSRVPFAAVAPRIIEFFGSNPDLAHAPKDKAALRDWLLARGAPSDFQIPASLMPLESFACSVVDVQGRKTYLSCYWRENKPDRSDHDLIHLLVGRRSDFRAAPSSSQPQRRELDGWSFASWSEGDVVYTLATAAPPEKLTPFLARAAPLRFLAVAD
jgi:hypothetical protein